MTNALIGSTGFVGQNLLNQIEFDNFYNSKNIFEARNKKFEFMICSGAPGSMFIANREPERDKTSIDTLIKSLSNIEVDQMILISTTAVYTKFDGEFNEATKDLNPKNQYGKSRLFLEKFCEDTFPNCLIIRLPALFGEGLKKNFLFDINNRLPRLLTQDLFKKIISVIDSDLESIIPEIYNFNTKTELYFFNEKTTFPERKILKLTNILEENKLSSIFFTNPNSSFQFYNLSNLWNDIQICLANKIKKINLVNEPLLAKKVFFSVEGTHMPENQASIHKENIKPLYSDLWRSQNNYISSSQDVLKEIISFMKKNKK